MSPFSTQEERGQRLLDAMPAIAWSAAADTFRFNYISPAAETLLGYPAQRWLDEPDFWMAHLHPEDRYVAMICHNETLAARPHQLVYRMIAADGRSVWLRDYVNVHSVDGRPEELFGVMVDITREREAEEAWKESRENFRRMVELSPDCIGVQIDGAYTYVNPAFVSLLGAKSDQEVLGASALSFAHPDYVDAARAKLERVHDGEALPYSRSKWRRVDGTYVDVEVAALPLRYDSRDAVHIIARDITDRVRAETELQVREERLDLLASGTHEAIWEWFPSRRELWTNDAYRQMVGVTPSPDRFFEEWLSHIHPDDREQAWSLVMSAMAESRPVWWHEYRFRHSDGTERYILDRGHTGTSPAGEPRVIGALLDVTSLREAERMRAAAETKFRWLVEQSVVAVYMMSGNRLTYINDTGALMLGYTAEQLKSMDLTTLLQGDDDPAAVFGGRPNVARIRRNDGSIVHIAFYPNEVMIDGEPIIIGTGADITDSVHAQQALADSERRYRELVEDVTDILYTADEEGRLTSLSRSFERITGSGVGDWLGRPFTELFAKQLPTAVPQEPSDDERIIREYEMVSRNGSVVTFEVSSQPRYVKGVLTGTIGMARDVTEQRNAARAIEEAKRMSSLGQVAASLAHEFNNVLMGIQPFVEVISRNVALGRPVHDALGHITRAIARGKRASQEILRFASPNEPHLRAIDAQVWLPSLLGQLSATLPSTVRITSSVAPDVRFIRGDREHLEQVITNLVFNARDAIANDGSIHVAVSVEGAFVHLSISDNGCGIAPAMLDRIFEPLFTTKRNGTGLGLAIARRLMERQGGSLTAENRAEGGSVFHVLVPSASAAPAAAPLPVVRTVPNVTRILIVEDDPSVATGLEALLQSEGYETMWVASAAEVCEAAREMLPQVAIIDVNLPDGNGADLVPVLRAEHAALPIILSTGHVELNVSDKKERILSLMKPYELSDLLNAIGTVTAPV